MTTPPVPPGRPEDHDDPTGVRALLAGLGDPGPMPADLVDRINASIAAEQQAREPRTDRTVVPFRRRLPSWPKIGLAAAAVAAVAVGIPAMLGTGPGDVLSSLSGVTGDTSADSAAGSAAKSMPEGARDDRAGSPLTLASTGTAYTSSGLATQARTVLDRGTMFGASSSSPAGAGPATTEAGLRTCLTALGVATSLPVSGDVGTYDGRPAVVAVVSSNTGQDVYAVDPDCDAAHPLVIAGPLPLG